jgi:dATP pyrophosphohydrolase
LPNGHGIVSFFENESILPVSLTSILSRKRARKQTNRYASFMLTQQHKQPISALVVIYTAALDVLLLERADYPDAWQSVTGSREGDETLRETAIREVAEETGLDATCYELSDWQQQNVYDIYSKWVHRFPPGTTHNTEHVFGLQLPQPIAVQLSPREHVNYLWLPWNEAADKVFSPSNREAILQLPERKGSDLP